jgi:hypothetical protein
MTLAEVEAILGPSGDYRTGPSADWRPDYNPITGKAVRTGLPVWHTDTDIIFASFDRSGLVEQTYHEACAKLPQTPTENLFWRARRLWRRWFPNT